LREILQAKSLYYTCEAWINMSPHSQRRAGEVPFGLSFKITLIVFIISALGFGLIGLIGFVYFRITSKNSIQNELLGEARQLLRMIDAHLDYAYQHIIIMSKLKETTDAIRRAKAIAEMKGLYEKLPLDKARIDEIEEMYPRDRAIIGITWGRFRTGGFSEIFVTEDTGFNVLASNETSDFVQSDEHWWKEAFEKGAYLGDVEYDESACKWSVTIAASVIDDETGDKAGVIKGIYNWDVIQLMFEEFALSQSKTYTALLIDGEGTIIAASNNDLFRKNVKDLVGWQVMLQECSAFPWHVGEASIQEPSGNSTVAQTIAFLSSNSGGDSGEERDWAVIVTDANRTLYSGARNVIYQLAAFFLALTVIVSCALYFGIRYFLSPMRELVEGMRLVSRGEIDTKVQVRTNDELKILGEGFNYMTSSLKELYESLEKKIRELDEINKLKSEFVANMSHELKTPLTSIYGFAEIMKEQGSDYLQEKHKKFLTRIMTNSQILLRSINEILDVGKIESGRIKMFIEEFKIRPIIDACIEMTESLMRQKPVKIIKNVPEDIVLRTDRAKLRQIVMNLLSNAVKFTEKGKITVSALTRGGLLELAVADTGIGIKEEQKPHVFEKFHQLDGSHTRKYGGTGLGLYIVKRLAQLLGGEGLQVYGSYSSGL